MTNSTKNIILRLLNQIKKGNKMKKIILLVLLASFGYLSAESFNIREFYKKSLENTPQDPNDFSIQETLGKMYPQSVLDSANDQNPANFTNAQVEKNFGPKNPDDPKDKGAKGIGGFIQGEKGLKYKKYKTYEKDEYEVDLNGNVVKDEKGKPKILHKAGSLVYDKNNKPVEEEELLVRKKLGEKTASVNLGNIAKSTGRARCVIARGQNFFNYVCTRTGIKYGNDNGKDTPESAKRNCEANCTSKTQCYAVKNPLLDQSKNKTEVLSHAISITKEQTQNSIKKTFNPVTSKVRSISFKIKNNTDIYFNFSYKDESGHSRVLSKNLRLTKRDIDVEDKDKGWVEKKYTINAKISEVEFFVSLTPKIYGDISKDEGEKRNQELQNILNQFSDKKEEKKALIVDFENIILEIPKVNRFVCGTQNIKNNSFVRDSCSKGDLISLVADNGEAIQVCKGGSGDNEDGTFSDEKTCSNSCIDQGFCELETPKLQIEGFFNMKEACLGETSGEKRADNCGANTCTKARENGAPILNERVFDAQGNYVDTIINGSIVLGATRPRLVSSDILIDYQEKIKKETKDRALVSMLHNQTFVVSKKINETRETSYASKVVKAGKNNSKNIQEVFVRIKPSNTLYEKPAYLYTMVVLLTSDRDHKTNVVKYDKNGENESSGANCLSKYYYFLNNSNELIPFAKRQCYNFSDGNAIDYASFNEMLDSWHSKSPTTYAPIFKKYQDVLSKVKELKYNKKITRDYSGTGTFKEEKVPRQNSQYYIEEQLFNDKSIPMTAKGPVRARAFFGIPQGGNVSTDPNSQGVGSNILLGEIYHFVKSNNDIPKYIIKKNNGNLPIIGSGDIPIQYLVYTYLSDKQMREDELLKIFEEAKEENKYLIYNALEQSDQLITELDDDSLLKNPLVSVFLVGDDKKFSAYATFSARDSDVGSAGYSFMWWEDKDIEQKKDISNISPSDIRETANSDNFSIDAPISFKYASHLGANRTSITLFEDKDLSTIGDKQIRFGYGTGDFKASECKPFVKQDKTVESVCLPWWTIEREYDEKIDKPIIDKGFKEAIREMAVPVQGKLVEVCTKVESNANAEFINNESRTIHCNSYYSKLQGGSCYENPMQSDCFVDTCPIKVKESCKLKNVLSSENNLKSLVTTAPRKQHLHSRKNRIVKKLDETKLNLKTYVYHCPPTENIEFNQVCEKKEMVRMAPANCNDERESIDENGNTSTTKEPTKEQKEQLKSGYIFCDTNRSIINESGNLVGFKGTCPISKKEVVCKINQVSRTTKTCVLPIFKNEIYDDISNQTINRECSDFYIDVASGEEDIYKNNPSCLRTNQAADSRKGELTVNFRNKHVNKTFILTKNYQDKEVVEYCKYEGVKRAELPLIDYQGKKEACRDSSREVMNVDSVIKDSKEILFAQSIGVLDEGDFISGIDNDPKIEVPYNDNDDDDDYTSSSSTDGLIKLDFGKARGFYGDREEVFTYLSWKDFVDEKKKELIKKSFEDSSLNFFTDKLLAFSGRDRIEVMPQTMGSNYYLSEWVKPEFDVNRVIGANNSGFFAPHDCHCTAYCDGWLSFFGGPNDRRDYHCWFKSNPSLKVYKNATLGLSIILPTPSDYEFIFYDRKGLVLAREQIGRARIISAPPGRLQALSLVEKLKSPRQVELETKLIPQKKKEIEDEEKRISKLLPITHIKQIGFSLKHRGSNWNNSDYKFFGNSTHWNYEAFHTGDGYQVCTWFQKYKYQRFELHTRYYDVLALNEKSGAIEKIFSQRDGFWKDWAELPNNLYRRFQNRLEEQGFPRLDFNCQGEGATWNPLQNITGDYCVSHFDTSLDGLYEPQEYVDSGKRNYTCQIEGVSYHHYRDNGLDNDRENAFNEEEFYCFNEDEKKAFEISRTQKWGESQATDRFRNNYETHQKFFDSAKCRQNTTSDKSCSAILLPRTYNKNNNVLLKSCNVNETLERLRRELQVLEDELPREAPWAGANDPWSPVGGGTIFGLSSTDQTRTLMSRSLEYIKNTSIYSIDIIDKETGDITKKKLEFPLPFANQVFFTYVKNVEKRRYTCCSRFQQ